MVAGARKVPTLVWKAIALSLLFSVVHAKLWSWGGDSTYNGDFANPPNAIFYSVPTAVDLSQVSAAESITEVACGRRHCLFLTKHTDASVALYGWGYNQQGFFVNPRQANTWNQTMIIPRPIRITTGFCAGNPIKLAASNSVSYLACSNGKVFTWYGVEPQEVTLMADLASFGNITHLESYGYGINGATGTSDPNLYGRYEFVAVVHNSMTLSTLSRVPFTANSNDSLSYMMSCDSSFCSDQNICPNTVACLNSPLNTPGDSSPITKLQVTEGFVLVLKASLNLYGWGSNQYGVLRNTTIGGPAPLPPPQGGPMAAPSGGPVMGPMAAPIGGPVMGPMAAPIGGPVMGPMMGPMSAPGGPPVQPPGSPPVTPPVSPPVAAPVAAPVTAGPPPADVVYFDNLVLIKTNISDFAISSRHVIARKAIIGNVIAWGFNNDSNYLLGSNDDMNKPNKPPNSPELNSGIGKSNAIAVAGASSFAIDATTGQIWSFGPNDNGELGDGTASPSPAKVLGGAIIGRDLKNARIVGCEGDRCGFAVAITENGKSMFAWGDNRDGKLGSTDRVASIKEVVMPTPSAIINFVHTTSSLILYTASQQLYAVGGDVAPDVFVSAGSGAPFVAGQLCAGSTISKSGGSTTPIRLSDTIITSDLNDYFDNFKLTAGHDFMVITKSNRADVGQQPKTKFFACGGDESAKIHATYPGKEVTSFVSPLNPTGTVDFISSGRAHTIYQLVDGSSVTVRGFGANQYRQITTANVNSTSDTFAFNVATVFPNSEIVKLAAADQFSVALVRNKATNITSAYWWGTVEISKEDGSLIVSITSPSTAPTQISGGSLGSQNVTDIWTGFHYASSNRALDSRTFYGYGYLILKTQNGLLHAWGSNYWGVFASISTPDVESNFTSGPRLIPLPANETALQVAAGATHFLVLTDTGKLLGYGNNFVDGGLGKPLAQHMARAPLLLNDQPPLLNRRIKFISARSFNAVWTSVEVTPSMADISNAATSLTIRGADFGEDEALLDVYLQNDIPCIVSSLTDVEVVCTPVGTLPVGSLSATVRRAEDAVTRVIGNVVQASSFTPSTTEIGRTAASTIITGAGLSPTSTIAFNNSITDCTTFYFNSSAVRCTFTVTSQLELGPLFASVSTFGGASSYQQIGIVVPEPIVTSSVALVAANGILEIFGSEFAGDSVDSLAPDVSFFPVVQCNYLAHNSTYYKCALSTGSTDVLFATLRRSGGASASTLVATIVPTPLISLYANAIPMASSATRVTITGQNFGTESTRNLLSVTLTNGNSTFDCPLAPDVVTDGSLVCSITGATLVPYTSLDAQITFATGLSAVATVRTIVPAPAITPNNHTRAVTVTALTIEGQNFAEEGNLVALSAGTCTIKAENTSFIVCEVLSGLTANTPLTATVTAFSGPSETVVVAFIVPVPTIDAAEVNCTVELTRLVITGANFDPEDTATSLFVNTIPLLCDDSFVTETSITCYVDFSLPDFQSGPVSAIISANGGQSAQVQVGIFTSPNDLGNTLGGAGSLETWAYAVIVVAVVVVVIIVAVVLFIIIRRRIRMAKDIEMQTQIKVTEEQKAMFNIKSSDLKIINKLGEGAYGAVYLGTLGSKHVAIKKLSNTMISSNASEFFREASLMLSIKPHRNLVNCFGMVQEQNNFSLVLEFVPNGSLDKLVSEQAVYMNPQIYFKLARGIAAGMGALSTQLIVHRDLAARNVLLSTDYEPKVADFGYARVVGAEGAAQTSASIGPVRWMAPECIANREYSQKSDVWAYGCTLFEIFSGEVPFQGKELVDVALAVRDNQSTPGVPSSAPKYMADLMTWCWRYEAQDRPTFAEIVKYLDDHRPGDIHYVGASIDEVDVAAPRPKKKKTKSDGTEYESIITTPPGSAESLKE